MISFYIIISFLLYFCPKWQENNGVKILVIQVFQLVNLICMPKCTLRVNIVKRCFVSGKNSKPKFVQILSLGLMMEKFNNTLLAVYL